MTARSCRKAGWRWSRRAEAAMKPCFADTFFFLAWWNRRDLAHARVEEFVGEYTGRLLTTRWVLMEVADAFASSRMRREVRRLFAEIESDEQITVVEPA